MDDNKDHKVISYEELNEKDKKTMGNTSKNEITKNIKPSNKGKKPNIENLGLCSKSNKIIYISILIAIILAIVITLIILYVYPCIKCEKKIPIPPETTEEDQTIISKTTEIEETKPDKPYEPKYSGIDFEKLGPMEEEFKISTKVNDLTRIYVNQKYYENITVNGQLTQILVDRKTNYDIFVISSKESEGIKKYFYNETFLCAITISSECISADDEYCVPEKMADFVDQDYSHIRNLEEIENLEDIPVPLCLFNLTNNNVITSMICPKTLSSTKKYTMILDLYFFRPPSIKRPDKIRSNITITTKLLENNQKLIRETNGGICDVENFIYSYCTTDMNTTVDSNDKIIRYDEIAFTNITTDSMNSYIKNKITTLIDDSDKVVSLDSEKYNKTLFKVLSGLEPYMQYDEHFSTEQFEELFLVTKNVTEPKDKRRRLMSTRKNGVYSDNLFYFEHYGGVIINLDMKDNTGIGSENEEAIVDLKIDSNNKTLINLKEFTNIDKIINDLIVLSKAGNSLATELFEKINENLNNLTDIISVNITYLNDFLLYKDLTDIFDSTLSLKSIKNINYTIVSKANVLNTQLDKIYTEIDNGSLRKHIKILNTNISDFIRDSHVIINKIFNNLKDLGSKLNSPKNKISEISTYYLNYTSTSYITTIKDAQDVLMNYYKREKDLIIPQVNQILNSFEEMVSKSLQKEKSIINNLYINLVNNNYEINNATIEEFNKTITNLFNSEKYITEIINLVKNKVNKEMEDGFFTSSYDIESKNETFNTFIEEALEIARKLDNDELIDKTFDEIMIHFREAFTSVINYMNKVKEEEFPLNENTLKDSLFTPSDKKNITNELKESSAYIVNKIRNENNYYLSNIDEKVGKFLKDNKDYLDNLIGELEVLLTNDYFKKFSNYYEEALSSCLNKVNKTIQDNKILANNYFDDLSGIAGDTKKILDLLKNFHTDDAHLPNIIPIDSPTHYWVLTSWYDLINSKSKTTGYLKKYSSFKANIDYSNKFVKETLPREFLNKYKNMITQIKELLQSVENNKITDLYPDFSELNFINDNLKKINNVYTIINNVLSDEIFNKKFLPTINTYKNNQIKEIEKIGKYIEEKNKIINTQPTANDNTNDFCISFTRKKTYTCTNGALSYPESSDYYCLPLSDKSNNYKKIKNTEIDSDENLKIFIKEFNDYYSKISNYINSYNNKIIELNNIIISIEKDTLDKNITLNYLSEIEKRVDYILSLKYGDEIVKASYKYYKKNIEERIGNALNSISEKWDNAFDTLEEEINGNMTKFKNNIMEYGIMAIAYETVISNNITRKFVESIENHQKNEFNYTISYYYNFFLKEVNSFYQYVFNKIPTNPRGFNNILDIRKKEVNDLFNRIINKINESKKVAISKTRQNYILETSSVNFFGINSILSNNIESTKISLQDKASNIFSLSTDIPNDVESFAAKFYLENSENGKQIEKLYEPINKNLFIELDLETFKELLYENWIFDQNEFINNLNNTLADYGLEIKNEYSILEDEIKKDLEEEIHNFFTKEKIYDGINEFYTTQIRNFDENKLNQIQLYINNILNSIKTHLANEAERIKNSLTSYTTDFSTIKNRLNNIKEEIFNKTRNTLVYIISEFHDNLNNRFYNNYVESGLDKYIVKAEEYHSPQDEYFLLSSYYNIHDIIVKNVKELVEDYKNKTRMKIDDQYKEFIDLKSKEMKLDNIKKIINEEIDKEFNSNLLKVLEKYAIYNPGETDYSSYDLSEDIINKTEETIDSNIKKINEVVLSIKGDHFDVSSLYGWENIDFDRSLIKFNSINTKFSTFIKPQIDSESDNINQFLKTVAKENFNNLLDIIIPSFGNEFFERIIRYNENFKIITLYDNLKFSLVVSLQYYIFLYTFKDVEALTKDLKLKLYNLNNLDSIAEKNNNKVLELLNKQIEEFISESSKDIINKYFSFIKNDASIESSFDNSIITKINQNLEAVRNELEDKYTDSLNIFFKEKIIASYSKIMKEKTREMVETVNDQKELIKSNIDGLFTLVPEKILDDINEKLNDTIESINEYNNNFNNFKISDDLINYLNEFGENILKPCFEDLSTFLNDLTKKYILSNLEENSENYEKDFNLNNALELIKNINSTIENYYNEIKLGLNNYGETEEKYENILENKIGYLDKRRRRRLNNEQTEEDILEEYRQKFADKSIGDTFYKLLNNSKMAKSTINSFEEFKNVGENISKTITKLNTAYKKSEKIIKDNNYEKEINDKLIEKLEDLKNNTLNYYISINDSFYDMSNYIKESINKVYNLLKQSANITYSTFTKKYEEIANDNYFIDNEQYEEKTDINKITYDSISQNTNFTTDVTITSLVEKARFKFKLEFEEDGEVKKPKVVASIINESKPKKMTFLIYSGYGTCGKFVQRIIVEFKGVNYTTNIDFNTDSTQINATIITNFDSYKYSQERFKINDVGNTECKTVLGVTMCVKPTTCNEKNEIVLDAKNHTIVEEKNYTIQKIIDD